MTGWLKLHRSIIDNPLWGAEPFSKAQAWVHLLLIANHKDGGFIKNGQWIEVKRGQTGESVLSLSKRFRWSKNKVLRFLDLLEKQRMIEVKTTHLTTIITICNYNDYQGGETPDGTPNETPHETPNDTTLETQTRSKEVKNEKKSNGKRFAPPSLDEVILFMDEHAKAGKLAADFHDFYTSKDWYVGSRKMKDWKAAARRWVRNNMDKVNTPKASEAEAEWEKVMKYIQRHGSQQAMPDMSEQLRLAIRAAGGIREIGMSNEFQMKKRRSDFIAAFKEFSDAD